MLHWISSGMHHWFEFCSLQGYEELQQFMPLCEIRRFATPEHLGENSVVWFDCSQNGEPVNQDVASLWTASCLVEAFDGSFPAATESLWMVQQQPDMHFPLGKNCQSLSAGFCYARCETCRIAHMFIISTIMLSHIA